MSVEFERPSRFSLFMAGPWGRVARVVLGLVIIAASLLLIGGTAGWVLAAAGLLPITAGALNLCPVAPLWGGHFFGADYCAVRGHSERAPRTGQR